MKEKPALFRAIEAGNAQLMQQLIAAGEDVNATSDELVSYPLAYAIKCGHAELVPALLAAGAKPNPPDWWEPSALHLAAGEGDTATVRLLLAAGADTEARNRIDEAPIHFALHSIDTLNALIEGGADPLARDEWENTLLHMATCWDELPQLQRALELVKVVDVRDEFGKTPLHYAAKRDNPFALRFLLEAGADINARSVHGETPLMTAACEGSLKALDYLLNAGADALLADNGGWNALHHAAYYGDIPVIARLLQAGIPIDSTTHEGNTPLCLNISGDWRDDECAAFLLQAGATPVEPDEEMLRFSKLSGDEKIRAIVNSLKGTDEPT